MGIIGARHPGYADSLLIGIDLRCCRVRESDAERRDHAEDCWSIEFEHYRLLNM